MDAHHQRQAILIGASMLLLGAAAWLGVGLSARRPVSRRIVALACSSSGRWLASGTADGRIRIWDLEHSRVLRDLHEANGPLNDLRFDPAEQYLAIANMNLTLASLSTAASTRVIRDDQANYGAVRFTSDGQTVLTINGRGAIIAVDIATGKVHTKVCCSTIYGEVALSSDDTLIVGAGHRPSVWDFRSGALVGHLTAAREFLAYGPIAIDADRARLYIGNQDGRVHVSDLRTRQFLRASPPQPGYVSTISVLGGTGWIAYAAHDGTVKLWNADTREQRVVVSAQATSNLAHDAVHGRTALGTESGQVQLWNLLEGRLLSTLSSEH